MKLRDNTLYSAVKLLCTATLLAATGIVPLSVAQTGGERPAATIGGEAIYDSDYLPQIQGQIYKVRQQEYTLKLNALEGAINKRLLKAEAAKRGVSEEELLRQEVDAKVPDPSESEVEQRFAIQMFRGMAPNTSKDQIAAEMKKGMVEQARNIYFAGLRERAGVRIFLPPPRMEVATDPGRIRGNPDAPITIVEFSDFQCPYCYQAYFTTKKLLAKYGEKVRLSYRDMPVAGVEADPNGTAAAARCAGEQGKYWEYHDMLFENQDDVSPRAFLDFAKGLNLDGAKFEACLKSAKFHDSIQKDFQDGLQLGITGTPYFFINGIPISGARPQPEFEAIIDLELSLLGQ